MTENKQVGFLEIQTYGLMSSQTDAFLSGWVSVFPYKQVNIHSPTPPTCWMSSCPTMCEEEGSVLLTLVYKGKIGGFALENWLCQGKN
jgi:hypothetical protein